MVVHSEGSVKTRTMQRLFDEKRCKKVEVEDMMPTPWIMRGRLAAMAQLVDRSST